MPFCPACGVRVAQGPARCGLDGCLLRRLQCGQCEGEVAPSDRFCGHCRHNLIVHPATSRPLHMRTAGVWRRLGAVLFDSLAWWMFLQCFIDLPAPWVLALVPLWASLIETRDGQTPGQQIFSLKRLFLDGTSPLLRDWPQCLKSACWPFVQSPTRLFWVPD